MKRFILVPLFVLLLSAGVSYAHEEGQCEEHCAKMERAHMCGHGGMEGSEMMGGNGMICPEKMMHHMMEPKLMNIEMYLENKDELGITSDQKDKLKAIKIDFAKTAIGKDAEIKTAMLDLKVAAMMDKPDFNVVRQQIPTISKLYTDLFTAKVNAMEKGYNVLNDQQKQKVLSLKEQMMKKMKDEMKGEK
jgi:hypothetical protein